ncbi:trypsin-like peptidase domain-containing protein [Actinoplanes sp. NPDC049596]|uniref:trypsin-like peptidase domain-containing protein n=1 Tax=unclassified Actinoplanes TaxID=2626549 RepID=UPI003416189F
MSIPDQHTPTPGQGAWPPPSAPEPSGAPQNGSAPYSGGAPHTGDTAQFGAAPQLGNPAHPGAAPQLGNPAHPGGAPQLGGAPHAGGPYSGGWAPSGGWPPPGGWPPHGGWQQPADPHGRPRRTRRIAVAVGAGVAALVIAAGGGFAAGWSLHPDTGSAASPVLPLAPATGSQSGGGLGSGSGDGSGGGFGSGSGGGFGSGSSGGFGSGSNGGSGASGTTAAGGATDAQVAAVAAKVDPALVDITTVLGAQNEEAAGTGIVLTADGVILTNNHVVAGATSITVTDIGNGRNYQAAVVGYDRSADIAVLKLSGASGLTTASLATTTVKTGDPVVAIGNAGGTGGTPSAVGGAVTALGQSITASDESSGSSEQLTGLIEVNADIEAGDSGGPLLTTGGQVIGVDTAASAGFRYQASGGDGYAIPIATATKLATQIRAGQSSSAVHIGATAYLGIETTDSSGTTGPAILGVVADSPAAKAGLTRGDVITSVAGTQVGSATALTTLLDRYHPGNKVKIAWTDVSGQSHTATATLATGPVG